MNIIKWREFSRISVLITRLIFIRTYFWWHISRGRLLNQPCMRICWQLCTKLSIPALFFTRFVPKFRSCSAEHVKSMILNEHPSYVCPRKRGRFFLPTDLPSFLTSSPSLRDPFYRVILELQLQPSARHLSTWVERRPLHAYRKIAYSILKKCFSTSAFLFDIRQKITSP